jgi:hypothetical protein
MNYDLKKNFRKYFNVIFLVLLASCGHRTDGDVLARAYTDYCLLDRRYEGVSLALGDNDAVVQKIRLLGVDYNLSFGDSLWSSFVGNDHLVHSEGTPLHRALYLINRDIDCLAYHAQQLERRALCVQPVYEKLNELRRVLCSVMRVAQAHATYSEESQFIESQRTQRYHTALLENIAARNAPAVHTHTVVHHEHIIPVRQQTVVVHNYL